jgi:hypothetical protein
VREKNARQGGERRRLELRKPRREKEAARSRLRFGDELLRGVARHDREARPAAGLDGLLAAALGECFGGDEPDHVVVREPVHRLLPLGSGERLWLSEPFGEASPMPRRGRKHAEIAVSRAQHRVRAVTVTLNENRQRWIAPRVVGERNRPRIQTGERGLLHRHLDRLPEAGSRPIGERRQRPRDRIDRAAIVGEATGCIAGRQIGEAGGVERPRRSQGADRLGGPGGARTAEPEVRDRHVQEMRMARADCGGVEAEPVAIGEGEVFEQHVGALEKLVETRTAAAIGKLDRHAPFVGVAKEERQRAVGRRLVGDERRPEPVPLSVRPLYLEHVGTEIGEHAPGERAAQIAQIENAQMSEGAGHRSLLTPEPFSPQVERRRESCAT